MILDLNPVMSIIANVPAAIVSTVRLLTRIGLLANSLLSDRSFPDCPPIT